MDAGAPLPARLLAALAQRSLDVPERAVAALVDAGGEAAAVHVPRHGLLVVRAAAGSADLRVSAVPGEGAVGRAFATGEAVEHGDAAGHRLVAPVRAGNEVVGTIAVSGRDRSAVDRLRADLDASAAAVGLALADERARWTAGAERLRVAALLRKVARVAGGRDVRPVLQSLLEDAAALLGGARLVTLEPDGAGYVVAAGVGVALDVLTAGRVTAGDLGAGADGGEPLVVLDGGTAPRVVDLVGGVPAVVAVGRTAGERGAVVVAGWDGAHRPGDADVTLVGALADLVALAGRLARDDLRAHDDELGRTRDDFLATLSHELRTPLAVIKGAVETIQAHGDGLPAPLRDRLIERIRHRVDQEVELVDTLLALSQLDRGQYQIRRAPFDLADLCREVAVGHMETSERVVVVDGVSEAPVVADRVALRHAVSNLVANALKFSSGEVVVTVRRARRSWLVEVDDDGEGIPSALRERVFERFLHADQRERPRGGVGVGLAVVRGIVELHGGRVGVGSSDAGGARFWFEIPDL